MGTFENDREPTQSQESWNMASCLQSFKAHNPSIVYDKPPDGGYGWVIVGGHFINIGIGYGFTKSIGIFFPYIKESLDVNNTTTSLIFSIMMFFQYCGSLIGRDSNRLQDDPKM